MGEQKKQAVHIGQNAGDELFTLEDILKGFEEYRKEHKWPDETRVPLRTFRHWAKKGLFSAPFRGKHNQALYPRRAIEDIGAVRWMQWECKLTLTQIKELFADLPFCFSDGIKGLFIKSGVDAFKKLLSLAPKQGLTKAKEFLLFCSEQEERRIDKAYLKKIAAIYKKFDAELFRQYLNKNGDQLFHEAMVGHFVIEDEDLPAEDRAEAEFNMELLSQIDAVRNGGRADDAALKVFMAIKPELYKAARFKLKLDKARRKLMFYEHVEK